MWFGEQEALAPSEQFLLLGISSVALVAVIQVWAARGTALWWMRWGAVLAVAAFLVHIRAAELILFLAGHLLAILALTSAVVLRRPPGGLSTRGLELLGILFVLTVEFTFAIILASTQPLQWFLVGAGAGSAAAIVDFGMTRGRWLMLASGLAAVCLSAASAGIGYGNLLGLVERLSNRYPASDGGEWWNAFEMLGGGTFLYWLWRLFARLSTRGDKVGNNFADLSGSNASNSAAPSVQPGRLWQAGTGWRLALRIIFVWPAFALLTIVLVSPVLEAYWRLPPRSPQPPAAPRDKNYEALLAFPDKLDWSACPSREFGDVSPDATSAFFEANLPHVQELEAILQRPMRPTIDYHPFAEAIAPSEKSSIQSTVTALRIIHAGAKRASALQEHFESLRLLLLLRRPFQRSGLLAHLYLGQTIEQLGLELCYQSRLELTREQCRALMALVAESVANDEPQASTAQRTDEWVTIVRGWRKRVLQAVAPSETFGSSFLAWSLDNDHKNHRALQLTLICELALCQYAMDNDGNPPSTLDELVSRYLPSIPLDPYSGNPLHYYHAGEFIPYFAYSVGPNGVPNNWVGPTGEFGRTVNDQDDVSIARYAYKAAEP